MARACCIHALLHTIHAILAISANFNMISYKIQVLELTNTMDTFKHFHALFHTIFTRFSCNFGYFCHLWVNFNMFAIKKHVAELKNSFVVLAEAMGLKAPKKRPKALQSPSARGTIFDIMHQNNLVFDVSPNIVIWYNGSKSCLKV